MPEIFGMSQPHLSNAEDPDSQFRHASSRDD